jgi:hypothetical protein
MKVIGTGNPIALTLRLREHEVDGLREELRQRELVAEDALANGDQFGRVDRKTPIEVREAAVAMRNQLDVAEANEQGRVVVTGPTWLLGPSIITATIEAGEQFAAPEALRDAISTASAWSETLIGYDHVENHGLDR